MIVDRRGLTEEPLDLTRGGIIRFRAPGAAYFKRRHPGMKWRTAKKRATRERSDDRQRRTKPRNRAKFFEERMICKRFFDHMMEELSGIQAEINRLLADIQSAGEALQVPAEMLKNGP